MTRVDLTRIDQSSSPGTRRALLRFLAAAPVAAGLAALLGNDPAAAERDPEKGSSHRRKRRKRRHDPGDDKRNRKGKRHGKGKRKKKPAASPTSPTSPTSPPPTSPDPGPGRTTVTRTFTNTTPITILPGVDGAVATPATPYPSVIAVAGFVNGRILDVTLTLHGLSHTFPGDIDILLAAERLPGLNAFVMSDAGGFTDVSDVTLTLDDQAAAELPDFGGFASGTFRPTNHTAPGSEEFPAPAPAPSGNVGLSVFTGSDPNGTWQLFVVDDEGRDGGSIANGWSLEITAEVDA